jgi:hypothetical protein
MASETSWAHDRRTAVLIALANPENVDVLERLRTLAALLEAGDVTHDQHTAELAELRSTFVRPP